MPRAIPVHRSRSPLKAPASARRLYERRPDRREDKDFYKSKAWRTRRDAFLRAYPLCMDCRKLNCFVAAQHVHHKADRKDSPELALEWDNLEALCPPCHNRKRRGDG